MDQRDKDSAMDEPFALSADGWVYRWQTIESQYSQLRAGITTKAAPILKFHTPYADDETVRAHRVRFARSIGVEARTMTFAEQVHGSGVYIVRETDIGRGSYLAHEAIPQTDALVTTLIGVPLIIFVADCAPIFFYDPKGKVIALVHAGWRGTAADILRRVLNVLDGLGVVREHLHVAIGPCIHGAAYEVDDPVIDALSKVDADSLQVASQKTRPGHYMLDLPTFHRLLLEKEGIPKAHVESSHYCTYTHARHFYSYRREGALAGRMAAYMVQLS